MGLCPFKPMVKLEHTVYVQCVYCLYNTNNAPNYMLSLIVLSKEL